MNEKRLSINTICRLCGIMPHTLRAWEARYQALMPSRTEGGHRFYGQGDLGRLQLLVRLTSKGHRISHIAGLSNQELKELNTLVPGQSAVQPSRSRDYQTVLNELLVFIQRNDFRGLTVKLSELRREVGLRDYVLNVLSPLIGEVGSLVANGRMQIYQEHLLSALIRDQIAQISFFSTHELNVRKIIVTTPSGNWHELGILLAATLCRHRRWKTHYMGPNLPADSLVGSISALETSTVLLGAAPWEEDNQQKILDYLSELDAQVPFTVDLWIGGLKGVPKEFKNLNILPVAQLEDLDQRLM